MYIVKVLQSGIELNSIKLEPGHTYYVGRGSDCDVVLNNEAGISRKHVKVSDETGQWQIELIARYGNIVFDNQNYTSLPIQGEMIVQIPPFELRIEAATKQATSSQFDSADKPDQTFTEFANNAPLVPKNNIPQPPMAPSVPAIVEQQVEGNMENTAEIELPIETILHIKLPEGKQEIVKLEGSSWVVGRDKNAEIPIKYDYLSKEHFEITKTEDGEYYITDLGSSNGTKVNNVALTPDNPQLLNSGDTISVKKLRFKLKIKDAEFNRKLDNIIEDEFNLPVVRSSDPFLPQPFAANQGQGVVPYDENENNFSFLKPMTYKNNKPKAAIFIILILGLIYFLSSDPTPQREVAEEKGDNSKFTNLSQEQKELINNSLDLANNHFQNGSYALCLAELVKVHKLVPDYNGSKKLKNHCEIGEKLRLENEARRAQEEKEKQIKE
ncbi:MAG: FHA domain-containing protein, partial [Bdellovibrionales bacterium]|nr:FHA domain-containing protein [Bdellovibrionales bacterium]